jgi:hypothetical protein
MFIESKNQLLIPWNSVFTETMFVAAKVMKTGATDLNLTKNLQVSNF